TPWRPQKNHPNAHDYKEKVTRFGDEPKNLGKIKEHLFSKGWGQRAPLHYLHKSPFTGTF
ncbi:MAG: hypothetical protein OQK07_01310, partial [Rhodospirillales bacterium]|nr:hypothetical protein [Rhodospirillales bacterium]